MSKAFFSDAGVEFSSMWGAENPKTTAICFMINTLDVSSVRAENGARDKDGNQFLFLSVTVTYLKHVSDIFVWIKMLFFLRTRIYCCFIQGFALKLARYWSSKMVRPWERSTGKTDRSFLNIFLNGNISNSIFLFMFIRAAFINSWLDVTGSCSSHQIFNGSVLVTTKKHVSINNFTQALNFCLSE